MEMEISQFSVAKKIQCLKNIIIVFIIGSFVAGLVGLWMMYVPLAFFCLSHGG